MNKEERREIFKRDGYICQRCSCRATELAHRIANTKSNRKYIARYYLSLYGKFLKKVTVKKIINHRQNVKASCHLCNSYFNIGNQPVKRNRLLRKIFEEINDN
jgi:hypothetical protein